MDSLSSNDLLHYLTRIHKFLIGDEETIRFRFVSSAAEKILVKIATNSEILKNENNDDDCKSAATQLATVLETNIHNFTLKYYFEKTESGEKEIVYQKMPVHAKELKPLRKPNTYEEEIPIKNSVMSSFKARWLNATLKFLKSDQLVLQYPEMTSEQVEFVRNIVCQCMTSVNREEDVMFGFKGLYEPLADALRKAGLKYHLQLSPVVTDSDMRCLKFEKHPIATQKDNKLHNTEIRTSVSKTNSKNVRKVTITVEATDITGSQNAEQLKTTGIGSSQNAQQLKATDITGIQNTQLRTTDIGSHNAQLKTTVKCGTQNAEQLKATDVNGSQNTVKTNGQYIQNVQSFETIDLTRDSHTIIDLYDQTKPPKTQTQTPQPLLKKISHLEDICKSLTGTFKKTSLLQLRDFIMDDNKDQLVFPAMKIAEVVFLMHWKVIISRVEVIRMFGVEGQITLDDIRQSIKANAHRFSVKVTMDNLRKEGSEKLKDIVFHKDYVHSVYAERMKAQSESPISSLNMSKQDAKFLKQASMVESDFIEYTLLQLTEFFTDDVHASLVFSKPPPEKDVFLNGILALKDSLAAKILNPRLLHLWNNIQKLLKKNSKKYTVKKIRPDGMDHRDFTFRKEPYFGPGNTNASSTNAKQTNTTEISVAKDSRAESLIRKKNTLKALYDTAEPDSCISKPEANNSVEYNTINDIPRRVNDKSSARVIPPAVNTSVPVAPPDRSRVITLDDRRSRPGPAKAKIIAALQQPVFSEKGAKMMRLMGWEGGALGVRGDGIVEPIMPELDTAHRAGLGLSKNKTTTVQLITDIPSPVSIINLPEMPTTMNFKIGTLQTLLVLMTSDHSAIEINFPGVLSKKMWAFIRRSVCMFNRKGKVNPEELKLRKVCEDIMSSMTDTDYIITASFSKTRRKIQYVKCKGIYLPGTNEWTDVVNLDHVKKQQLNLIYPKDSPQQNLIEASYNYTGANAHKNTVFANKTATNTDYNSNNATKGYNGDSMNNTTNNKGVERNINVNTKDATNVEKEAVEYMTKDAIPQTPQQIHITNAESHIANTKDAVSNNVDPKNAVNNKVDSKDALCNNVGAEDAISHNVGLKDAKSNNVGPEDAITHNVDPKDAIGNNVGAEVAISHNVDLNDAISNNVGREDTITHNVDPKDAIDNNVSPEDAISNNVGAEGAISHNVGMKDAISNNVGPKDTITHNVDPNDAIDNNVGPEDAISNNVGLEDAISNNVDLEYAISNLNHNQECANVFAKNTNVYNIARDSETQDDTAKNDIIYTENEIIIPTIDLTDDSEDTICNLEDDVLFRLDEFRCFIMKEILEFCKESCPMNRQNNKKQLKIRKVIYPKEALNRTQINCVKNLIRIIKKSPQNYKQHINEPRSVIEEIVSHIKGYFLEAHFPPEKVVSTEPSDNKFYKRIILQKVFISNTSRNFDMFNSYMNNMSELSKIVTNNDSNIQSDNSSNKTSKLSDTENYIATSFNGNTQNIVDEQTKNVSNISAMDQKSHINIENRLLNSDVDDEKSTFNNRQDITEDVDAKVENNNLSEHKNNKTERFRTNDAKRRASVKFDEKCMYDYGLPKSHYPMCDHPVFLVGDCLCCSSVKIMEDKVNTDDSTDKKEVTYIILEKQSIEVTENEISDTQIESNLDKNVDVSEKNADELSMLMKRQRSNDDLLPKNVIKEQDSLLSNIVPHKDENIQNISDNDKVGNNSPSHPPIKKIKYEEYKKEVIVVPKNYPQTQIDNKMAGILQKSILSSIDYKQELPLLRCLGIHNGALTYCCHTEESYNSLERLVKSLGGLEIMEKLDNKKSRHVMAFRINTFFEEKVESIFERFETLNSGLSTKEWSVLKKEQCSDYIVIQVELDELSYKYILDAKFSLHAGIDEAQFNIVW